MAIEGQLILAFTVWNDIFAEAADVIHDGWDISMFKMNYNGFIGISSGHKVSEITLRIKMNVSCLETCLSPFKLLFFTWHHLKCILLFCNRLCTQTCYAGLDHRFPLRTSFCIISVVQIEKHLHCWMNSGSCCHAKSLYPLDMHTSSAVSVRLAHRFSHFPWIAFNFKALAWTCTVTYQTTVCVNVWAQIQLVQHLLFSVMPSSRFELHLPAHCFENYKFSVSHQTHTHLFSYIVQLNGLTATWLPCSSNCPISTRNPRHTVTEPSEPQGHADFLCVFLLYMRHMHNKHRGSAHRSSKFNEML